MSICSKHQISDPSCKMCQCTPEELLGRESWSVSLNEAVTKGAVTCSKCKFVFYKTTLSCPLCHTIWE